MTDEKPKRLEPYPQKDDRSLAYHVARTTLDAGASLVPGAGYALGEIVKHYIGDPLEKRREGWFTQVGEGLIELQTRFEGFDPASLDQNEEFISAVYEATQIAMKTHRQEKVKALRNAIINVARGCGISEVERGSFFAAIDRFHHLHIQVLWRSYDHLWLERLEKHSKLRRSIREKTPLPTRIGEYHGPLDPTPEEGVVNHIYGDLIREGFTKSINITDSGERFLQFISDPTA